MDDKENKDECYEIFYRKIRLKNIYRYMEWFLYKYVAPFTALFDMWLNMLPAIIDVIF